MVKLFWLHITLRIQDFKTRPLRDFETEHFVSGTGDENPSWEWPKLLKIKFPQNDLYWVLQRFCCRPRTPSRPGGFFSRCIFLDQVTAMKLYLSFSFYLFFPCLFLLVPFSLSPFLFISFSFFPSPVVCLSLPFFPFSFFFSQRTKSHQKISWRVEQVVFL